MKSKTGAGVPQPADLYRIYETLLGRFGPQGWWPVGRNGDTDPMFEMAVGAILTQNTSWKNVEKALSNLKREGVFSTEGILKTGNRKLEDILRPSGYFRQKSERLKIFSAWLVDKYGGDLRNFFKKSLEAARAELLSLKGIGPETADSILLYAGGKPVFVIDAYTKRLCREMNVTELDSYEDLRKFFEDNLPRDVGVYREFHALIVTQGKRK